MACRRSVTCWEPRWSALVSPSASSSRDTSVLPQPSSIHRPWVSHVPAVHSRCCIRSAAADRRWYHSRADCPFAAPSIVGIWLRCLYLHAMVFLTGSQLKCEWDNCSPASHMVVSFRINKPLSSVCLWLRRPSITLLCNFAMYSCVCSYFTWLFINT